LGKGAEWQECDPFYLPNMAGAEKAVWFLRIIISGSTSHQLSRLSRTICLFYKTKGITLVIMSPDAKIPQELEREVVVLDFPLLTRDELKIILGGLEESPGVKVENEAMVLLTSIIS
jgi:hypothetical protein